MSSCIFCRIIKGDIPSFKLFESDKTLAFLDIGPLSKGHALVIPKHHGAKLADIPDDHLTEILASTGATMAALLTKKLIMFTSICIQIPKPNETEGLGVKWPTKPADMEQLKAYCEELKAKI
ncbi:Hit family 1 [Fusarium coicis]|nr:Hit family 1 [Fusarium coicis]